MRDDSDGLRGPRNESSIDRLLRGSVLVGAGDGQPTDNTFHELSGVSDGDASALNRSHICAVLRSIKR